MIEKVVNLGSGILLYITGNGGKILACAGTIGKDALTNIYTMGLNGMAHHLTAPLVNYFLEIAKETYITFWYNVVKYSMLEAPNTTFYIKQYMKMKLGKVNNRIRFHEIGGRQDYDYINGSYKVYDERYGNVVFELQGDIIAISVLRRNLSDGSYGKPINDFSKI